MTRTDRCRTFLAQVKKVSAVSLAEAFGKVLRSRRRNAGLTQEQLALLIQIDRNYVSLLERGVHLPTVTMLFKLASGLQLPPSILISDVEAIIGPLTGDIEQLG